MLEVDIFFVWALFEGKYTVFLRIALCHFHVIRGHTVYHLTTVPFCIFKYFVLMNFIFILYTL